MNRKLSVFRTQGASFLPDIQTRTRLPFSCFFASSAPFPSVRFKTETPQKQTQPQRLAPSHTAPPSAASRPAVPRLRLSRSFFLFLSLLSAPPCSALRHAIRSGKLPSAPAVQDTTATIPAVTDDEKRTPTPPRLSVFSISGIRCRCSPDILPRFVYPPPPPPRDSPLPFCSPLAPASSRSSPDRNGSSPETSPPFPRHAPPRLDDLLTRGIFFRGVREKPGSLFPPFPHDAPAPVPRLPLLAGAAKISRFPTKVPRVNAENRHSPNSSLRTFRKTGPPS